MVNKSTFPDDAETRTSRPSPFQSGLIDFATGQTVKTIDIPPTDRNLEWTLDRRSVLYVDARSGVSNIWGQPIDGSPPRQLTNFKSDLIFAFDLSNDGKQMVLSRAMIRSRGCGLLPSDLIRQQTHPLPARW